ncbi:MAG: translocation/assembly module TamB domain-containing protein, partial [Bacteroidales bacterium]|nr:translocation/assembly module TamB domain-containing protein [Bacteroidales bacterium]
MSLSAWLLIQNSHVQTWLARRFIENIEVKTGGSIRIDKVKVRFLKQVLLEDVLVRDQLGDTVLFLPETKIKLGHIDLRNNIFDINSVRIQNPLVYFQEDPGGGLNISFLLESYISDTSKAAVDLKINKIDFIDGLFRYHTFGAKPDTMGFSKDYIEVSELRVRINGFEKDRDRLRFDLQNFEGRDISGFKVSNVMAQFSFSDSKLNGSVVKIETPNSQIDIKDFNLSLLKSEGKSFLERLQFNAAIDPGTHISERDLRFFVNDYNAYAQIGFNGNLYLDQGRMNWSELKLSYGRVVKLRGDVSIENISDPRNSELDLILDTLIYRPAFHKKSLLSLIIDLDTLNTPISIASMGELHLAGSFSGSLDNMKTQVSASCDAFQFQGNLKTSAGENPKEVFLSGNYAGTIFNVDSVLNSNIGIKNAEFTSSFSGSAVNLQQYSILIDMRLSDLDWLGYDYKDITIQGNALNQTFDGLVVVDDKNVGMELDTKVDFSGDTPSFTFGLDLTKAQLNILNISNLDSLEVLDLHLFGSLSGTNLDDIEGQIWITDSYYKNSRGQLPFTQFNLTIGPDLGLRKINLVSDYIDARLLGEIHFTEIVQQLESVARQYLPIRVGVVGYNPTYLNDFTFNLQLKNPRPLTEILTPKIIFKDNTQLSGFFKEGGQQWEIQGFSPQYVVMGKQFTEMAFQASSYLDTMIFDCSVGKVQLDSDTDFDQIVAHFQMIPDKLDADIAWDNLDSVVTRGRVKPTLHFVPGLSSMPRTILSAPSSDIIYNDSLWHIDLTQLVLDHQYIKIDSLVVNHNSEDLMVDGAISDLPHDTLYVNFTRLNLRHIETFKKKRKFNLEGIVDGTAKFFNLHEKGLFLADMNISDLTVNDELLGKTHISSERIAGSDEVFMEVVTSRGDISTINMSGRFNPVTDKINATIDLEKLKMNVFNAVLEPTLRDIRGIASGKIQVQGSRSDPTLNGEILMQKAGFNVGYLNTRYTFTQPVIISQNAFIVKGLVARDRLGNEAIVNGGVHHSKFKDISLDFKLDVTDFLCMETNESSGHRYWGTVFATGVASLTGPLKNIKIDVSARSRPGTDFSVPVSKSQSVRRIDFINYISKDSVEIDPDLFSYTNDDHNQGYDVDLSGLAVQIDLDVTPDARVNIIFDAQTGDVIRAKGRGNINIDVDTRGGFSIDGDYLIDQGDYIFTLENMPIKRFAVKPGGHVNLNGNIGDANLDVVAIYKTKAALYDLVLDESDQDLKQRIPVECQLMMSGRLETPGLKFDIVLPPNSDDIARSQLSNLTQEELNKQIFSLLILNRFSPLPGLNSSSSRSYESAGISTTTEVLS